MTKEEWVRRWLDEVLGMALRPQKFTDEAAWGLHTRERLEKTKDLLGRMYDSFHFPAKPPSPGGAPGQAAQPTQQRKEQPR